MGNFELTRPDVLEKTLNSTGNSSKELPAIFENPVLTVEEAAVFLKVSAKTVYRYSKIGAIPHKRIGGIFRFLRSELIEFLKGE